jgi:hypothetical protein
MRRELEMGAPSWFNLHAYRLLLSWLWLWLWALCANAQRCPRGHGPLLMRHGKAAVRLRADGGGHDLLDRALSQPHGLMQVADELAAKEPQVVAMLMLGLSRRL